MSVESKMDKVAGARAKIGADTPARRRLSLLFDPDSFVELDGFVTCGAEPPGVICGYGAVMGSPAYAFVQDSSQGGGAVGAAHAAKIKKVYDLALKTGVPVVGIYDSYGARVAEGAGALNAYGEILLQINSLSGVVPQISLVLGTCAGTSAMLACSGDFVIMSKDAEFFLTPPLEDGAEGASAEAAAKSGVAHIVAGGEAEAIQSARTLLTRLPLNNLASPPVSDSAQPTASPIAGQSGSDTVAAVCDAGSSLELLADFGGAAYTAIATMGGLPCGVVATSGDKLDADACAKIAKVVSVCDAFQLPVLTFVNTPGFAPEGDGGLCRSVRDSARLAHVYAEATTAKIAVVTGNAYGSAYVALAGRSANSDYTIAWPAATISALEPATAVAFLYSDRITKDNPRQAVEDAYCAEEASALTAARGGYIDDLVEPSLTRPAILSALDLLAAKRVATNPKKHGNLPM